MARFKKRKDGRYATSITINGQKYYLYGSTQKELETKRLKLLTESQKNMLIKTSSMPFKDYCDDWFHSRQINRNANTRDMYF